MRYFDTIVIGGGPAGLMAAAQAAKLKQSVLLIEKNSELGEKLLLSGRGRCNFTNAEPDIQKFLSCYGDKGKFLNSAFSKFGPAETVKFFNDNNVPSVQERGGRIFPDESIRDIKGGQIVLNALYNLCKKHGVHILRRSPVKTIEIRSEIKNNIKIKKITRVITANEEIEGGRFIIATGGKSYHKTGSTGDGYILAQKAGHNIIKTWPALVPVKIKEPWVKLGNGCDLKNVRLSVYKDNKKIDSRFGDMELTHFGISGPIVMDLSSHIPDWIDSNLASPFRRGVAKGDGRVIRGDVAEGDRGVSGEIIFSLDLKPALSHEVLRKRITSDFNKFGEKRFAAILRKLMPAKMIDVVLELSDVPHDKPAAYISDEEIDELARLLKDIRMTLNNDKNDCGLFGFEHAVVTRGGVDLKEIDPATMRSKLCDNLYFAGEILDLNGPSGGFNLQICWSTGYVAGANFLD